MPGPAEAAHELDVLRRHCDDPDRGYDDVHKTVPHLGEVPQDADLTPWIERVVAPSARGPAGQTGSMTQATPQVVEVSSVSAQAGP